MSPERVKVDVDGRHLWLSNLDKVLYPKVGFKKGELIDYYARIAPVMLAHIADRPVTLRRYPDGVEGQSFFEKHVPSHAPSWIRTVKVPASAAGGRSRHGEIEYALVLDRASLIWAANLATIEFHVPLWRAGTKEIPAAPDHLVFDLDPGPGTSIVECCTIACWIREELDRRGLEPVAKTTGSKGLQLYARIEDVPTDKARALSLEIAQQVEKDHGELVVTNMRKELRRHKVLIDWSQNHPAKTTVGAYSLRAREEPTVSTPVTWDEVEACGRDREPDRLYFLPSEVLERVERLGDLFAPVARTTP